jgi:glycosyltransferase involved in cell wall biosynthesis
MKKVLIVTNLFHSSPRIPGLAKYLNEFGWEAIILTTPLGENPQLQFRGPEISDNISMIVEAGPTPPFETELLKKKFHIKNSGIIFEMGRWAYKVLDEFLYYPDTFKYWIPYAMEAADFIFDTEHVDAIISSSSPVTTHIIAQKLKHKYHVPWVADLRDLWSQNHNYLYGNIRRYFDRRLELRVLKDADKLVTVTPMWSEELGKLHGWMEYDVMCHCKSYHNRDVACITNGFDPDNINTFQNPLCKKFIIIYTGMIYKNYYKNIEKLGCAVQELIQDGSINAQDIEIRFFGPEDECVNKMVDKYSFIRYYGIVPKKTALIGQQESQVLLLFDWEDCKELGFYPLKTFEYFAAQRPILAVGGCTGTSVEKLLYNTGAGYHGVKIGKIKSILINYYNQFKDSGEVKYEGDMFKIVQYDYRHMAESYVKLLDEIV